MSTEIEQLHEEQATIIEGGKTLPAILHTSPFASAVQYAAVVEGSTLETVVQQAAVKLPAEYNQYLRVWINDIEISREQWATTRVKAGQNVYIRVVPGKSGKDIFKMIALIAIAVVAWQFAPQIAATIAGGSATAGTITATLGGKLLVAGVMTAINVVGFLALNALIPPPSFGSMTQDDPRFDLTSTSNQFSPFANVPRLFGKRRLFPMMAARPYSELQGDDEYLRMALVVGWGPLKIENIKIGETPITAFKNVEYEVREGWSTDADLTLFTRTVTEENLSIRLEPFQSTGYYPGGYGYGGEYYTYNPDTQAYGPFSATTSNDWVERTTAVNSVEFSVDLAFPQGLFYFDNKGNKKQATVIVEVQYRPVGGTTWVNAVWDNSQDDGFGTNGQITAKAADSSAIRRSGRVKLPSAGQYTVRLRRITANSGDKYVDVSYWTCLRSIRPDYPVLQKNVALIAIRMKASNQLNGVPQTISCEATSYLPVWNGSTWSYQLSANPAWAYTDLLRRRGGETLLTDDRIDLTTIKAWADACDATAPNATEPRWSYSDVLEGGSIFDNMRRVASNARAFPIVRDGKHSIVRDIPQTVPVQHITPRNSFGYSGVKSFIDYPHAMRVTFFNKDMGYQRDERIVYYDGYTAANATKFETLELQGCTSATQAFREARYHMAVARLRPEEHSVSMDIEALRCTVGDLVRFSHDAIAIGIAATRVRSYTLDGTGKVATITFEDDLYFEAGKSYVIRARQVTGNSVLLSINNPGEGYANTVTLTTPAVTTAAPDIGDLVIFGEATKESAPMIIKKIDADDDFACTVHMVDAADAVHTADTGTIPAFNTLLSLPSESTTTDVPKVFISAVRSDDSVVITNPDGSLSYRILTQLQQPESSTARVDYFEVQHRIQNSSAWHTTTVERANGFGYIDGVEVGAVYELRSRAVPVDGQPSDWSTSVTHTVVGKLGAPNLPTGLSATAIPGGIDLAWTNSTSDDFWQVEIYENTTSNSATATKVAETSANKYSRLGLSSADGVRFYWLKSFNTSGVSTAFVGPVSTTALNRVLLGTLSNEAVNLPADAAGVVSSFATAEGQLSLTDGPTNVLASATLSATASGCTGTINTAADTPVAGKPKGYYRVTAMSAETGTLTITATYNGQSVNRVFSVTKARTGAQGNPASVLTLSSSAQTFTYDGSGAASPSSQSITLTANLQNIGAAVTFDAIGYNAAGTSLGAITLTGTGNSRSLSLANFGAAAYVVVTATASGFSDTTTIVRLAAGAPGAQPITGFLTNEAATLAAATDGTVSNFAPAGGTFKVFEGLTDRTGTSVTYTVQSSSNVTISINTAGAYTVTAMSADTATATLRAVYGGVTIDKALSLSKSRQGVPGNNASVLTLTSTAQTMTFDGNGNLSPASQSVTFTANLQNVSGTITWAAVAYNSAGLNLSNITLDGTGSTRTLTSALFTGNAGTAYVVVTATLGSLSDTTTVVRLQAGAKGDPGNDAIVGFLTNEAVTLAASSTGVVSDFAPAGGTFKVFQGLTDRTTNSTFTVSSNTNCTVSINGTTGVYSVSAMTADTASATLQAVFGGATIQKVLSLAKSKTGGVGDPGTAAISGYVTNEAIQLFAFADGTVTSYTGASGSFRIFSGNTDISSSFTLATGVSGNPQNLTVSYNLRDYSITGGFDANEDTASLTIRATGSGAYAGVTLDKVVSLSKAKGGYEIVGALPTTNNFAGRVVFLNTDGKLYRYIGAPTNAYIASVAAADVSGTLGSTQIADGAITSGKIGDGQVGSGKIADGAIATIKIADSAITAAKITDATISTAKIADSAITAVKIGNGAVSSAKFAAGIEPVGVFTGSALPTSQTTSTIYLTGTGKLYRWVGGAYSAVVDTGDLNGTISSAQIADGALTSGKFATGIEPVTVVSSLPASLSTRSVFNTSDNKLYRWNGSTYVATIPTTDLTGTIATAQIADGALTSGKFAAGIEPVTVVSSVPASQSTRSIFNTADNKLYRWNGSAYVATVPTTDLTGTIANTQIASVAATKITGVVGGGNLLANSGFKNFTGTIDTNGSLPASWAVYNNQGISITHRVVAGGLFGTNYVRLTANANTNQTFGVYGNTATGQYAGLWQPGLTYMLSFWARAGNAAAVGKTMSALFSNMGFTSATQVENPPLVEGTWQRYVWRAVPANNANTPNSEFYISLIEAGPPPAYTITSGGILEICAPQVEQGELVSAYAPRPDEILPSSITATEIANDAVTSNKIIAGAVVAGKIATGAVEADKIAANAVTAAKINAGAVEADKIAANAVTAVKINAGAVEADKIAANAVTAVKINAGAVEADKIAANAVTAGKINAGAVEADKIAANAVTAVKINAGAVEADKIAANAVTAVKINAAAVEADKIASNAVTADKIAANAVTAGKIQAGAVSTDKLAANSITASKLAIVAAGMALNRDPQMATDAWLLGIGGSTLLAANTQFTNTTQNDSPVGTSVLQYSGSTGADWSSEIIPIDSSKVYRISLWARQTGASLHYITAAFMNATGAYLSGGGTGWNSGTYHYWGRGNQPFPSTWTFYSVVFGPGQAFTAPAGAKFIRLAMLQNYGSTATDTVYMADYRIEEVLPSTLIQNGAIVTDKLAANAVTAAKIAANTITANEIAASTITSNQIATDTIVAGNIAAGAIGASEIAANAVTAVKINASAVEADKIAANAVTADKIAANAITAGKIAAGSIATNALVVTGRGAAINDDPLCQDPTAWKDGEHGTTATRVTITDAPSGDSAYRSNAGTVGVSNSGASGIETSKLYPVSSSKKYRLTAFVRTVGGAGVSYLRLVDQVGNQIFISNLEGFAPSSTWTRYSGFYQPSASVKSVRLRAILNWTGTTGYHEVTDFRLEEMSEADLIVDGAIVANKIAANAITAAKIASNSITTSKLLVTATANSISDDPMFQDPSAWELTPNTSFLSGTGEAGAVANTYIGSSVGTDQQNQSVKSYPIGPGKRYRLSANLYASAGNARNMYIYVEFYDQNGAYIGSGVTGWGGSKSGYTYGGQPPTGVWTRQGGQFGPGTGREIPANTRSVKIGIWFNYSSGSGLVFQACQDLRLEEVVEADIIADGAIIANKVAANAITAEKINANAVTADKINAGAVTAAKINVTSLSAISATVGTLQTATTGARVQIKDNIIKVFDGTSTSDTTGIRVKIGDLSL